ncbi:MAG: phage tail protein [Pseudomonadota bacterium]
MVSTNPTVSTSPKPKIRSDIDWLVSDGPETQREFLDSLEDGEILSLPYLFELWALDHQIPPDGDWTTWVVMGGRGAGKTRAGAEWVRSMVEGARPLDAGRARRLALVGETIDQVREVMIFGESGIMSCSPPDRRPQWLATRKQLHWPNGAMAQVFSAHDPESLRGPQFDGAWVDEFGCATVDKGTNQPNKFLDAKSSESSLPYSSNGQRDEYIQHQYIRALTSYWADADTNPVSTEYDAPMLDMEHAYYWAWDMRPYPAFPNNRALWSDGENYARGHWLNGRASARSLASVVQEICARAGIVACDTTALDGIVRGYTVDQVSDARSALQPLSLRYGFDAVERDGALRFVMRSGDAVADIDPDTVVRDPELDGVMEATRGSDVDLAGQVRLRFVEADGDFEVIAEEARLPDRPPQAVSSSEISLAMTRSEGRQTVERWLSESRLATDSVRLTVPPSRLNLGAGDVIAVPEKGGQGRYRVDRVEHSGGVQKLEAVRVEPESYRLSDFDDAVAPMRPFTRPGPLTPFFLDLPLMRGNEVPHAPHIAVTAEPWPGSAALYASDEDAGYLLNTLVNARTPVGVLETAMQAAPAGRVDRSPPVQVRMLSGQLESVSAFAFLGGANLCAVGDGRPDGWELVQFRDATLVDADTYLVSHLLRGQLGTETDEPWPAGSYVVRLDGSPDQIDLPEPKRGLSRYYRIGPADRPIDDPSFATAQLSFDGIGLRPLSPVHLCLDGQPGEDRVLRWVRRTRSDGDGWDGEDVPLAEETERYAVRIVQGETLVREAVTGAPLWVYGAADQAADALSGDYEIQVAQVSARFGPGRFGRLRLSAA